MPSWWTLEEHARHRCHDGSHAHISRAELGKLQAAGRVKFLSAGNAPLTVIAVRTEFDPTRAYDPAKDYPSELGMHDLSCYVGEELAVALALRLTWAQVMFSDISMRRESISCPETS